jgi:hypothetical protein
MLSKKVKCRVKKNKDGYSDITIEVKDKEGLTATGVFTVTVSKVFKGEAVDSTGWKLLTCSKKVKEGCVWNFDNECNGYDRGEKTGECCKVDSPFGCLVKGDRYACFKDWQSDQCTENPTCPEDYFAVSSQSCTPPCSDECSSNQKECTDNTHYKVCGNYDSDSCLEWSNKIDCGSGKICSDGDCSPAKASLSLEFSDVVYKKMGMYHYYYHTRTFRETNGVGVTLTSGQLCYENKGGCDSASVNYRIKEGGQLVQDNKKFYTPRAWEEFTLEYWGTDDNGNSVYVGQSMTVSGSSHNP